MVVPLSIAGGVLAGLRRGRFVDRFISVAGLSGIAIPEFVSGILLIYVFSIRWKLLPATANPPDGASVAHPAEALRAAGRRRSSSCCSVTSPAWRAPAPSTPAEADYTRTATLKGLPRRLVLRRHVLRNGLLPTIAVIATQLGYLLGGLVAVERAFNYPGLGEHHPRRRAQQGLPARAGFGPRSSARCTCVATLLSDIAFAALNPRIRLEGA